MKKFLKRFIYILPAVLILILNILPLSSFAYTNYNYLVWPSAVPGGSSPYCEPDSFGIDDSHPYIIIQRADGYSDIVFAVVADDAYDWEEDDENILVRLYGSTYMFYNANASNGGTWYQREGWDHRNSTMQFVYSKAEKKITQTDFFGRGLNWDNMEITHTNMSLTSDDLKIDVSFNTNLSGVANRKVNGVVSDEFEMTLTNNSKFGIEYIFAVMPAGHNLKFYDRENDGVSAISYVYDINAPIQPTFIYYSEEWNYFYKSSISDGKAHLGAQQPDLANIYVAEKTLSPSIWHFTEKGQTINHKFKWSQIPLTNLGISGSMGYDVIVYAVKCDYGLASRQAEFEKGKYFVDYNNIEVVYSSNFTLSSSATYKYDSTDNSFGNIIYNNDADMIRDSWSSSATEDSEGNLHIEDKDLKYYFNNHDYVKEAVDNWKETMTFSYPSYYTESTYNNSDYDNMFGNTIGFVTYFLNFLPPQFLTLFGLGFGALIVIAIVKAVK